MTATKAPGMDSGEPMKYRASAGAGGVGTDGEVVGDRGAPEGTSTTSLPTEVWRAVPGWEGFYEVSDQGRVRSLPGQFRYGRILRLNLGTTGYFRVSLCRPGVTRNRAPVHQMVAAAFHGPRPEGHVCRHIDGDPLNNHASNLAWGTHSENVRDQIRHGSHAPSSKTHCPQGHPYDEENTYMSPDGRRSCRACTRVRLRARKQAQRAARRLAKAT